MNTTLPQKIIENNNKDYSVDDSVHTGNKRIIMKPRTIIIEIISIIITIDFVLIIQKRNNEINNILTP